MGGFNRDLRLAVRQQQKTQSPFRLVASGKGVRIVGIIAPIAEARFFEAETQVEPTATATRFVKLIDPASHIAQQVDLRSIRGNDGPPAIQQPFAPCNVGIGPRIAILDRFNEALVDQGCANGGVGQCAQRFVEDRPGVALIRIRGGAGDWGHGRQEDADAGLGRFVVQPGLPSSLQAVAAGLDERRYEALVLDQFKHITCDRNPIAQRLAELYGVGRTDVLESQRRGQRAIIAQLKRRNLQLEQSHLGRRTKGAKDARQLIAGARSTIVAGQ